MDIFRLLTQITETGGETTTAASETVEKVAEEMSIWDIIVDSESWYILIPLFLMSIYAIYVFVERFMALRKAAKDEKNFMDKIKDYVLDGKLDSAKNLCDTTDNPIARMIDKGISRIGKPMKDIQSSIENVGKLEIYKLENKLTSLATISGAAPMIGFLGTVIGMIKVFWKLKGEGLELDTLSGGIMMAMVTTVAGLIVGIIAYVSYNYLVSKVARVIQKMEGTSMEFIDILEEPGK